MHLWKKYFKYKLHLFFLNIIFLFLQEMISRQLLLENNNASAKET